MNLDDSVAVLFWMSFTVEPNSSTFIFFGSVVDEVNIRQLGVRITIHCHRTLSVSEMRKPHGSTLRGSVQRHLSLSAHTFLCNYGSSG
ncbi:hypothetical protein TNCV_2445121 [Trichonephila clavipes]|nr:hypothetical protein TNCV_2445121 [Trichonephila clavipes]